MVTIQLHWYVLVLYPLLATVVLITLGYAFGRNSAERPFQSEAINQDIEEAPWEDNLEDGYINEHIDEIYPDEERIPTVEKRR